MGNVFEKLKPGRKVLIESKRLGKLTERYVGWCPDRFFITTLKPIPGIKNSFTQLSSGVEIKFFLDGKIYIANTSILYHTFKPSGLLFLKETTLFRLISIRKTERVACFFPGGIAHLSNKEFFPGLIIDLSEDGAGFVFENPWHQEEFIVGEKANLKLIPIFGQNELIIPVYIQRLFKKDEKAGVGVAFAEDADEEQIEFIKRYVRSLQCRQKK